MKMINNYRVIGITGLARSGKDTSADYLLQHLPMGYVKYSFADPLKNMLRHGLGMTHEQLNGDQKEVVDPRFDCTPRRMMQTLGTEWGREHVHPHIWVRAMDNIIENQAVIPDVRFENEAKYVRENGVLIHVIKSSDEVSPMFAHSSEHGVRVEREDIVVKNAGTIDELHAYLDKVLEML